MRSVGVSSGSSGVGSSSSGIAQRYNRWLTQALHRKARDRSPRHLERIAATVNQFTCARHGHCYLFDAGDLRGPVTGAGGTRYFEPDGVAFCGDFRPSPAVRETITSD